MIFVTVGTQLPFDRLIRALDKWAGRGSHPDIFAQIGPSAYRPENMRYCKFLDAPQFREYIAQASLVIAHAGMGSIITALELGKPILVMPRRAGLGEHRNDHQLMTARHFIQQGRIHVAFHETELIELLNHQRLMPLSARISNQASPRLIAGLRQFVHTGELPELITVSPEEAASELLAPVPQSAA